MEVGTPGHSGRVRVCIQTAFDGKTCVYMTRGKTASGGRVTRIWTPHPLQKRYYFQIPGIER